MAHYSLERDVFAEPLPRYPVCKLYKLQLGADKLTRLCQWLWTVKQCRLDSVVYLNVHHISYRQICTLRISLRLYVGGSISKKRSNLL